MPVPPGLPPNILRVTDHREEIVAILNAAAGVTNLVSNRIFAMRAPQSAGRPYLVYQTVAHQPDQSHDGRGRADQYVFQVRVVGDSVRSATDLARAVDQAFTDIQPRRAAVRACLLESVVDQEDLSDSGGDQGVYQIVQTWRMLMEG